MENRTLQKRIDDYYHAKAVATAATAEQFQRLNEAIELARIADENSPVDRKMILGLLHEGDPDKGEDYLILEKALQDNQDELIMLEVTWEEDVVRLASFSGIPHPRSSESVRLIGVIGDRPKLLPVTDWSKGLSLPLRRAFILSNHVITQLMDSQMWKQIQVSDEGDSSLMNLSSLDFQLRVWRPEDGNYWIGKESVSRKIFPLELNPNLDVKVSSFFHHAFSLLGIEHIDTDGQGRLAIPDNAVKTTWG